MTTREPAVLVLEDGRTMHGNAYGAVGETFGEAVFSTGMTGYQETLTDPSYHGQVVIMTAPHIGNTGVNDEDSESARIWVAGYVVRNPSRISSNWRAQRSLDEELREFGVVGISGVDTRALTRHLREVGAMRVGIFSGSAAHRPVAELLQSVRESPGMVGANLTHDVTAAQPYTIDAVGKSVATIVAVDLGIKSMTPQRMAERGMTVHVVPATFDWSDIAALNPDGVFFSNGPGDPATADHAVDVMTGALEAKVPVFGICFGNQIFGRALGLSTYKLRFGHRGINQPVQDLTTGKVEVTAHNHGFAVQAPVGQDFDTPFGRARVSHICLNDGVVEGLELIDGSAFSVQYHPEAAAGPHDAAYLFDRFADAVTRGGDR
jgi:carbamoyl-phosphate synthase small subunit